MFCSKHFHPKNILRNDFDHFELDQADKVSQYAYQQPGRANTGLEFVAEVHTGLVYGIPYDSDILCMYEALGGPTPETFCVQN